MLLWLPFNKKLSVFSYRLEKMLRSILSTLEATEFWDTATSVVPLLEKIIGSMENNMQAENGENTTKQQGCCLMFV